MVILISDVSKYKTELCKEFQIHNYCKYGMKCKFAHGSNELVQKHYNAKFKSKLCKTFYTQGYCTYGLRCQFIHDQRQLSSQPQTFY